MKRRLATLIVLIVLVMTGFIASNPSVSSVEARPLMREMPASCSPVTITGPGLFGYSQSYNQTRYTTTYPHANCPEDDSLEQFGLQAYEGEDTNVFSLQCWDDRYLPEFQLGCDPGITVYHTGWYFNQYTYWHLKFNPYTASAYTVKAVANCTPGTYKTFTRYFKMYWNAGSTGSPVWQLKATTSGVYYHICDSSGR